ncbi:DNA-binding transcriptional regulator DsdC [Photobacterium sp. SDRW27]|uniref:DNA-binding transcriptional regulator DsdC n=1 Tax=Photobacterium obscurum TaxID=2829490 RepID=UPI002244CFB5|nr:DNA-binding transcriptional regulator DsdC [Photobacterium obscurum]MCW8328447.1 DNA-binding transcriptional regulator DsdC [Photobacterium obscurum]
MYAKNLPLTGNMLLNGYQLSKLHTFEVAARHLSFSMAAEELSLSPSAISHRMNGLEDELGFKLFERFHRKIKLTSEGERIYTALQSSLALINQEVAEIRNNEISGSLTVYSRPSIAQCWLVPKLADFHQRYPSISLDILTGNEYINFNNYNIDLAIYYDNKPPEGLNCEHLMSESIVPVCTREYAEKHDLFDNPSGLEQCTLLHDKQAWDYKSGSGEWHFWAKSFGLKGLDSCQAIGFDRSDLSIVAAMNHAGVAMGRNTLVNKRVQSGELVKPFPELEVDCLHNYYVVTPNSEHNPRVKVFVDWLMSE